MQLLSLIQQSASLVYDNQDDIGVYGPKEGTTGLDTVTLKSLLTEPETQSKTAERNFQSMKSYEKKRTAVIMKVDAKRKHHKIFKRVEAESTTAEPSPATDSETSKVATSISSPKTANTVYTAPVANGSVPVNALPSALTVSTTALPAISATAATENDISNDETDAESPENSPRKQTKAAKEQRKKDLSNRRKEEKRLKKEEARHKKEEERHRKEDEKHRQDDLKKQEADRKKQEKEQKKQRQDEEKRLKEEKQKNSKKAQGEEKNGDDDPENKDAVPSQPLTVQPKANLPQPVTSVQQMTQPQVVIVQPQPKIQQTAPSVQPVVTQTAAPKSS